MTAIDNLYLVQNGVDDVVDSDHNTLVEAVQFVNDSFGGTYNFGNGRDGNLKLGAISPNPTTAPTAIASGSGNLTGTYYYKYTVYNLSGETVESSASATVSPSGQYVTVTVPAFANNNNVTGFNIYRSVDNVTYYKVGVLPVDDATAGGSFVDNIPITSGAAPAGSNTTTTSATVYGTYYAKSVNIPSGTLTLNSTYPFLNIICQGDVTFNGTISGSNLVSNGSVPDSVSLIFGGGVSIYVSQTTQGAGYIGAAQVSNTTGLAIFNSTAQMWRSSSRFIYKQGQGGIGYGSGAKAGGTVFIAAKGKVNLSSAIINLNGQSGSATTGDGGGAGGVFVCASGEYINLSATSISANGGNGGTGSGSYPAGGGGGGGIVAIITDNISAVTGTPTISVNGGSGAAANGSAPAAAAGGGGGGCGGAGGAPITSVNAGNAGAVGISNYFTSNQMAIPVI